MAGPWFTVRKTDDVSWKTLEVIWLSDGRKSELAKVQIRARLLPPSLSKLSQTPDSHGH